MIKELTNIMIILFFGSIIRIANARKKRILITGKTNGTRPSKFTQSPKTVKNKIGNTISIIEKFYGVQYFL